MIAWLAALPNFVRFIVIFVVAITFEIAILALFGLLVGIDATPHSVGWIVVSITLALTSWLFALFIYLYVSGLGSVPDRESTRPSEVVGSRYYPSEIAYQNILWTLIALAVVDGEINERELVWIETFHLHWIRIGQGEYYEQLNKHELGRDALVNIARAFSSTGPQRIVEILFKNKIALTKIDRDILIKLCFLIATLDGPISLSKAELIIEIAAAIEISRNRLLEF